MREKRAKKSARSTGVRDALRFFCGGFRIDVHFTLSEYYDNLVWPTALEDEVCNVICASSAAPGPASPRHHQATLQKKPTLKLRLNSVAMSSRLPAARSDGSALSNPCVAPSFEADAVWYAVPFR